MKNPIWNNIFKKIPREEMVLIEVIKDIPLFRNLKRRQLKLLTKYLHQRYYKKSEVIFNEGDRGQGLYIIIEGKVEVYKSQGSKKRLMARLKNGDFFGEFALLDKLPRSATAQAVSNSKVIGFFNSDLLQIVQSRPRIGNILLYNLGYILSLRVRVTDEALEYALNKLSAYENTE